MCEPGAATPEVTLVSGALEGACVQPSVQVREDHGNAILLGLFFVVGEVKTFLGLLSGHRFVREDLVLAATTFGSDHW
jgi:hypothetical protein